MPTEEDLAKARQLREEGWQLIQDCWRDGKKANAKVKAFLDQMGAEDLETGFAKAVHQTDAISDQLRKEAGRVNEKCHLMANREKLETSLPQLEKQLEERNGEWAAIETEWRATWTPLGIDPGTPGEMRDWLSSHLNLMTTVKALHPQRLYIERLSDSIEEHRGQLLECLEEIGHASKGLSKKSLAELVEFAQEVLEDVALRLIQQTRLAEDIKRLQQSLPTKEREAKDAEEELSDWQKQWAKLMQKIGLAQDATPNQANAILDTLDRLFERLKERANFAIRVEAMRDFNRQFEDRAEALALAAEWKTANSSPTQIVHQLHEELTRAREAANKRRDLIEEHERQQHESKRLAQQIKQFETALKRDVQTSGLR